MRTSLRALHPRDGYYRGKPEPDHKRGYALIGPNGAVVGGPYSATSWANEARRTFFPEATVELVAVLH
jgi:hypothetical protein